MQGQLLSEIGAFFASYATGREWLMLFIGIGLGVMVPITLMPRIIKRYRVQYLTAQNSFLQLASHYLLTPTAAIQAAVSRLQETENLGPGERERLLNAITTGQRRLSIIVNQILTVMRLRSDKLGTQNQVINGPELLDAAMAQVLSFANLKNVHLEAKSLCKMRTEFRGDQRLTQQILVALLDNAVKFSPEGARVVAIVQEVGVSGFEFQIHDAAGGIRHEVLEQIGTSLVRGTDIMTFDHEGMGLGLFVAKQLADTLGMQLKFDSQGKLGTVVHLWIPE